MRFQLEVLIGIVGLALPLAAQAGQFQPAKASATQPAGTVPDEASAGTTARTPQSQSPANAQEAPSASSSAEASSAGTKAASAADVKSGMAVYDQKGGLVGKIGSVSSTGAVVNTGTARASIPISSFAKNDKGLVISMTKTELEAAAKKKSPK